MEARAHTGLYSRWRMNEKKEGVKGGGGVMWQELAHKKSVQILAGKTEDKETPEELGVGGKIILKWTIRE
jgi:hypothetical protein